MIQPVTQGASQIKTLAKWHFISMMYSHRHPATVFMKIITSALIAPICIAALSSLSQAAVVTVIDDFTTAQSVRIDGVGSNTSTVSSAGTIGGYRTMTLNTVGNIEDQTSLTVSSINDRLALSTPPGATANFTVTWAGAAGAGLGGINFTQDYPDLSLSSIRFALQSADISTNFTWTFEDASGNTASYTGIFPSHLSPNLPYDIKLSDFSNTLSLDWSAIDKISLSGGGTRNADISLVGDIVIVPEPTTALLSALGALCLLRRRR
jgi:hypothetical protein